MRRVTWVVPAVGLALAARALGGEGRLQSEIRELMDQHQALLVKGEKDEALSTLLKQVRTARKDGDWGKVGELLDEHKRKGLKRPEEGSETVRPEEKEPEASYTTTKERFASGDLAIGAVYYAPAVLDTKSPGLVIVHDGSKGMKAYVRALADELAGAGYALYLPYLRGQGGSEGRAEFLGGEVDDVVNAVGVLKSKECVKSEEVSVLGVRDGGALALLAAERLTDQVKYAVAISPVTDLEKLLRGSPGWKRDLKRLRLRWSIETKSELVSRSPAYKVSNLQAKVLVMHGKLDKFIPVSQAEGYCAVLSHRGKSYELKVYASAGKNLVRDRRLYIDDLKRFLKTGSTKARKKRKGQQPRDDGRPSARERARRGG